MLNGMKIKDIYYQEDMTKKDDFVYQKTQNY